jgi:hypothetical protein
MHFIAGRSDSRTSLATVGFAAAARSSIDTLSRLVGAMRRRAVAGAHRLRSLSSDHWFVVGFALLLLAFLFVLMVQPSAVGRGGR